MKTLTVTFAIVLTALLLAPARIFADECTTQYGGTTTCTSTSITINKQVQNPANNTFVENLGSTDTTFSADQHVLFQLTIKNTGTQNFSTVTVKDTFPNELTFGGGPGTFDKSTNTLTFTLDNLNAGESRTVQILGVVDPNKINKNQSMSCVVNTAVVSADNHSSQDTAQLCIQTNVLGATTLPIAGFNYYSLLIPFSLLGIVGIALIAKRG